MLAAAMRRPFPRGQLGDRPAETDELVTGLVDRAADLAADLDLALQLLRLDLLLEHDLALFQELLDEGLQLPGFGVDDLVLLFDADRQLGEARLMSRLLGGKRHKRIRPLRARGHSRRPGVL